MKTPNLPLSLGLLATACMAGASSAGVFSDTVYARETASWTAQAIGQDWANLLIVVPALLVFTVLIARGSESAIHIWRGLLAYVVYSYVLYAFFIHFNRLFLVYTGALAFSFYALVASLATQPVTLPAALPRARLAITTLMVSALLFALLWLSEILPANLAATTPASLAEVGLIVNPVHVLDLAFVLPAMAIAAALLRNRRPAGYLLAVPLLVFAVMMGIAIEFMFVAMSELGPGAAIMGVIVLLSALAAFRLLRDLRTQNV